MASINLNRESLKWLLLEGLAIVVSILLAFAIDAWWSDRQESTEEQLLLRQLKVEFESNVLQLVEKRALHAEARAAGLRILAITGPNADLTELEIGVVRDDFMSVLYQYTFDPHTGVLSSIIYSGKLDLIESEGLRVDIASWPARYQDLIEDEQAVAAIGRVRVRDHYDDFLAFRNHSRNLPEIGKSGFAEDIEGMLRERRFENTVSTKVSRTGQLLGFYDETRAQLMQTISLIDSELQ